MKRSDLNKFIKENIIETLSEGASSEEKRIALRAVKSIAKYRNVSEDEAKRDLINAVKELGSIKEADVDIEIPSIARQKANAKITNAKGFAQFILKAWNDISAEENESITKLADLKIAKDKLEKVAKAEEEAPLSEEELPSKEEVEDTTAAVKVLKKELDSLEEGAIDPAEYGDIGSAYLKGFNKPHSLDLDQLETLGRKIVKQLYKGDFDKAKAKFIKEEDFKNPILDKYLELKKSIDYKTVFPTDLQSFVDSLDNTEREGLENDLAEGVIKEDDDVDDKDAVAQAKAARGKHKKLDIAVKAKKALETEMKSLARKYSAADDVEKEKIKDDLKAKTAKKKELESLVAKLEKDVV